MPTDRAMELETQRCPTCGSWVPKMSETAPSPAVAEAERHGPGRCDRHKDEPGPSLYFDCCEVERLRELIKAREPAVAEAVEALEECYRVMRKHARAEYLDDGRRCVGCYMHRGHTPKCGYAAALTRARAALANLKR